MSESMPTRAESHTLRWSDVKVEKFEQENACIVTFRFLKGHEDQQGNVQGSREFFFAPKQERLHLGLSALLYAEAYTRGLFVDHLDVLLSDGSDRFPPTKSEIVCQAVFVMATTGCQLITDQEMRAHALNRKHQDFCLSVGILCYVTMYGFRRQAAQEAKTKNKGKYKALVQGTDQPAFLEIKKRLDEHLTLRKHGRRVITQRAKETLRKTLGGISVGRQEMERQVEEMDDRREQEDEVMDAEALDNERDEPEAWKGFTQGQMLMVE
ncbi:hypothetical protein BKA58DRAFT_455924 [Alternaria rosae]|uniref:uncharacterized protein n=1 Tax=Alternaria rosae TaxID=1187941 RepID=UPI001E8ED5E3|nr:uncharacterized protein BKA58DRAFT_455924 [Alternaria rosae]KAH6872368.1 hypothetical protein BKA58DRAFT_455924 [Alternaria rosae]